MSLTARIKQGCGWCQTMSTSGSRTAKSWESSCESKGGSRPFGEESSECYTVLLCPWSGRQHQIRISHTLRCSLSGRNRPPALWIGVCLWDRRRQGRYLSTAWETQSEFRESWQKPTLLAEILKYEGTRTLVGTTISPKPEAPESDEDEDIDGELKGPERPPVQRRPIRAARKPA